MLERNSCRRGGRRALFVILALGLGGTSAVVGQTATPVPASPPSAASSATPESASPPKAAPATPTAKPSPQTPSPPTSSPQTSSPPTSEPPTSEPPVSSSPSTSKQLAPGGKPQKSEIEPNATPTVPGSATTETVDVPGRPIVLVTGTSTYDDAFKSIKASLEIVKAAMAKAGLKPTGHPITIFSAPDDKGFKYEVAVPIAAKPADAHEIGGVTFGVSPAGKGLKFQHRGPYDDIDSTYDVITAYLDAKGLQVDNPYIEEYLDDLTTPDDPNLAVDIYVFEKK